MREDIKIIKLTGAISIISFLCTYLICINIETSFFSPDSIFVSNNFLLTISGGVLTGAILSLILEIQKYLLDKRQAENTLYNLAFRLYSEFFFMARNMQDHIDNAQMPVSKELLTGRTKSASDLMQAIRNIEYKTFFRFHAAFPSKHEEFCMKKTFELDRLLTDNIYLPIAWNTAMAKKIRQSSVAENNGLIASADSEIKQILHILSDNMEKGISEVDTYLQSLDNHCQGRYKWGTMKETLHKNPIHLQDAVTLHQFIKQHNQKDKS